LITRHTCQHADGGTYYVAQNGNNNTNTCNMAKKPATRKWTIADDVNVSPVVTGSSFRLAPTMKVLTTPYPRAVEHGMQRRAYTGETVIFAREMDSHCQDEWLGVKLDCSRRPCFGAHRMTNIRRRLITTSTGITKHHSSGLTDADGFALPAHTFRLTTTLFTTMADRPPKHGEVSGL
jgi:hypothetical protein